jgi:site-specific DNA recombinase
VVAGIPNSNRHTMNPLPAVDPALAVLYRRVSSAGQKNDGYGLSSQRTDGRAFARRHGLTIVADFAGDERSTVPLDEREAGRAALDAMMIHGAGVLLVACRDRLARDPYIAGHAVRAVALMGARIVFVDEGIGVADDDGMLLGDIKDALNAHERRRIVARLRRGRDEKAARDPHAYVGGRPKFGYRADRETRELVIDSDAADVVHAMFRWVRDGRSVRWIVEALNAASAGGRRWYPASVMRVLKDDIYKREHPGRIIDPKVFNAAQAALASRRKSAA